ncbi:S8 family serine peptidase [Selenomonas sp. KH1T6]|uniref:S8 family serine peptidase n=1 Tax=Selenomonas sp. KH1T6 TaxID=3158784 RepID=UPI0008A7B848|nr:Subtilase family protein [Selenomonas ruminantium]
MKGSKKLAILAALTMGFFFNGHAWAAEAADFQTPEYYASFGLDLLNAASAYAKGYTGKGVILGVCDQPANFLHPEFANKDYAQMIRDSWMEGGQPGVYDWSQLDHGTHVAGIIAANRDGVGMQGVAYNAGLAGSPVWYNFGEHVGEYADPFTPFYDRQDIKIINNSWGNSIYLDELLSGAVGELVKESSNLDEFTEKLAGFLYAEDRDMKYNRVQANGTATGKGKLLIFAAANSGHPTPAIEGLSSWFYDSAKRRFINVTALNNNAAGYTKGMSRQENGSINGDWLMTSFSDGAKYAEEYTLASPGKNILSANANFATTGSNYITKAGTSMATPFVTGAAGLVEEAFPYMNAKQIADTLLSTANQNITTNHSYFVTEQQDTDAAGQSHLKLNLFYFDSRVRSEKEIEEDLYTYYKDHYTEDREKFVAEYWPYFAHDAYYNVPLSAFVGQGVVDVGKAVGGPGALNARRLTTGNITHRFTSDGSPIVMYPIDTKGYDSTWSNDIKEIRVGKIAADSTEEDLAERYKYYDTNWISNPEAEPGARLLTALYVEKYNSDVDESGMEGLHVGLLKEGEGRLSLTGHNTYLGASVAKGGTLSIDGSVAGDAYSVEDGTIAGRGTIAGTLYNRNVAVAGDGEGRGDLTMNSLVSTGQLVSRVSAEGNNRFIVQDTADVSGSQVVLVNALPGETYEVLTAGRIQGDVANNAEHPAKVTGMLSTYGTVSGNILTATTVTANNMGNMTAEQAEALEAMDDMQKGLSGDSRKEEMRTLYSFGASDAQKALMEVIASEGPDLAVLPQQITLASRVISDRLSTAFSMQPVEVALPSSHLADSGTDTGLKVNMLLPVVQDNNA